jgi:hypothetical protein
VVEQGMWRIRTNEELRELHKDLDIAVDVKKKRLELIGRGIRKEKEGCIR